MLYASSLTGFTYNIITNSLLIYEINCLIEYDYDVVSLVESDQKRSEI